MKKLVTVTWSVTMETELPEEATLDSLNDWKGEHSELGARIVSEASCNVSWKCGEITDVSDIPDDEPANC